MSETKTPDLKTTPIPDEIEPDHSRNEWLDSCLNPAGELPEASIHGELSFTPLPVHELPFTGITNRLVMKNLEGNEIGQLWLEMPIGTDAMEPGACAQVEVAEVIERERGKGYGKALYLAALKSLPPNMGLKCSSHLSKDSFRMWKWLEEKGVAKHEGAPESLEPVAGGVYESPMFRTVF